MRTRCACLAAAFGVACALVACGSEAEPGTPVSASQRDERCPVALDPGPRPLAAIMRVLTPEARRFRSPETLRGYRVAAAFPLARDKSAPGLRRREYLRAARAGCGEDVARRSWVVVLDEPAAPAADLGLEALFLVRTAEGWRAWYSWLVNSYGDDGHFPGE